MLFPYNWREVKGEGVGSFEIVRKIENDTRLNIHSKNYIDIENIYPYFSMYIDISILVLA